MLLGMPMYLERVTGTYESIGIVGNVAKSNERGKLSLHERNAIILIANVIIILRPWRCAEYIMDYVSKFPNNVCLDLILMLLYIIIIFTYIF